MYLRELNENEKSLFLEAACRLSSADGTFSEEEAIMLEMFCQEMDIPFVEPVMDDDVEELIDRIDDVCDMQAKKIFIFELVGLAISDLRFDVSEKALIYQMCEKFDLPEKFVDDCEQITLEYLAMTERINDLILE